MLKVIISKTSYTPIKRFNSRGYLIHYYPQEEDTDNIICCEEVVNIINNTKEQLYQAIIECKYSASQIINILATSQQNPNNSDYLEYIAWKEYAEECASIIFDTPTLESVKAKKIEEINKYDSSTEVNSFTYSGNDYWLDKATRVGLMNSTTILKEAGETSTSLWLGNLHVVLPVDDVIDKLSQLEVYALECYNVTAQHKVAVSELQTIEEVKAYDITSGYPTKLDLT